jgi:hypothetical protein
MDYVSLLDFLCFKGTVGVEQNAFVKGEIFSLFALGSLDEALDLVVVGYDGDALLNGIDVVNYGRRGAMLACSHTRMQIAIAQRDTLLCYDGKTADELGSHFGHIVDGLFWIDIKSKAKVKIHNLSYEKEEQGAVENSDGKDDGSQSFASDVDESVIGDDDVYDENACDDDEYEYDNDDTNTDKDLK